MVNRKIYPGKTVTVFIDTKSDYITIAATAGVLVY